MDRFALFFKECRLRANLRQAEVAEDLGVVQATVSQWEKGGSMPNYDMLERIADYFSVDINMLLGYPCNSVLVYKKGLESLQLEKYKTLCDEDKELVAQQFNALVERLSRK